MNTETYTDFKPGHYGQTVLSIVHLKLKECKRAGRNLSMGEVYVALRAAGILSRNPRRLVNDTLTQARRFGKTKAMAYPDINLIVAESRF